MVWGLPKIPWDVSATFEGILCFSTGKRIRTENRNFQNCKEQSNITISGTSAALFPFRLSRTRVSDKNQSPGSASRHLPAAGPSGDASSPPPTRGRRLLQRDSPGDAQHQGMGTVVAVRDACLLRQGPYKLRTRASLGHRRSPPFPSLTLCPVPLHPHIPLATSGPILRMGLPVWPGGGAPPRSPPALGPPAQPLQATSVLPHPSLRVPATTVSTWTPPGPALQLPLCHHSIAAHGAGRRWLLLP